MVKFHELPLVIQIEIALARLGDWPPTLYGWSVIEGMSPAGLFEAYLRWHGIIGYTNLILDAHNVIFKGENHANT